MRNGSFSWEKRQGNGVDQPPPSSVEAKERHPPPLRACMACNRVNCTVFINYALFSSTTLLHSDIWHQLVTPVQVTNMPTCRFEIYLYSRNTGKYQVDNVLVSHATQVKT